MYSTKYTIKCPVNSRNDKDEKILLYTGGVSYAISNNRPIKDPHLWAPNGTRLSARCPFTGPKKLSISRAQPPPTCPSNVCCPHQKHYARGRINHRCINRENSIPLTEGIFFPELWPRFPGSPQ